MGEKTEAMLPILLILLFIIVGTIITSYVVLKFIKRFMWLARPIEVVGYIILFIALIWELWIKNITMDMFYNADFHYINTKLDEIYRLVFKAASQTFDELDRGRYGSYYELAQGKYVQYQMRFIDIIESVLKIISTVFIAIGRLAELLEKNIKFKVKSN